MANDKSHLVFGLIADVQYADMDDGTNYARTRKRFYRASLDLLKQAVSHWQTQHIAFVLQLGDLIDGWNKRRGGDQIAMSALKTALAPFKQLTCPTYHMVGNHDLYNFTRRQCLTFDLNSAAMKGVSAGKEDGLHYSVVVHPHLKVVVLDTYEVGVLGYDDCRDNANLKTATTILHRHNPNMDKNDATGMKKESKRFVAYNGGVSKEQLKWLDSQLADAEQQQQNVIVCGHVQLIPLLGNTVCALWNYEEVLKIIHAHDCVVLCLAGHDHDGGFTVDMAGIHHLIVNGVIETPSDTNAYATVFLRDKVLDIKGTGNVPSFTVPLIYNVS